MSRPLADSLLRLGWKNVFYSLRPRRNRRHFADDIFKCIFLNENEWISLRISLKFVSKVRINNIPSLVQIMAWRRPGDKPLCEPMVVSLLTYICVTRPQWVKSTPSIHTTTTWFDCGADGCVFIAPFYLHGWSPQEYQGLTAGWGPRLHKAPDSCKDYPLRLVTMCVITMP